LCRWDGEDDEGLLRVIRERKIDEAMTREGEIDEAGTVQIGQRADLVLLEENPLVDIINSRKVAGVMIRGRWLSRDQIEHGLASLEESARAPSRR